MTPPDAAGSSLEKLAVRLSGPDRRDRRAGHPCRALRCWPDALSAALLLLAGLLSAALLLLPPWPGAAGCSAAADRAFAFGICWGSPFGYSSRV